jgi:hypothetical protein
MPIAFTDNSLLLYFFDFYCVDGFGVEDSFGGGDWQAFDLDDMADKEV